ncbi:hypothetical protein KIN20_034915 [Parelaphostrongylus tenuis]|uniref:Uncharacterized protein n=1 Tax=Parelaphostrongylus tenuis TaxID=148309 RepID=A0AAD5WK34_PARTN|nr:hypothetical protein KIN20_034915 [Parelaphostrongylus tenuis]
MLAFNETTEAIRFYNNIGLDIMLLNVFVYWLELILLLSSMGSMTIYLVISKMNKRFHSMLRILMNLLCCGMLIASFFRLFMIPIRLLLVICYELPINHMVLLLRISPVLDLNL